MVLCQMLTSLLNPWGRGKYTKPDLFPPVFDAFKTKLLLEELIKLFPVLKCQLLSASKRPLFCGSVSYGHLPLAAAG